MEDLVSEIDSHGLGIETHTFNIINAILYADDIIVVSQSLDELQEMLNIVTRFGHSHEIKFNPNKTNGIAFGSSKRNSTIYLDHQPIKFGETIKYLGVILNNKLTPTAHIVARKQAATKVVNGLRRVGIFSPVTSVRLKLLLYNTYARPVLYYGLAVQSLNQTETNDVQKFESKIIKRMLGLS